MPYSEEQLRRIFDSTNGRCHICGTRLELSAYGRGGLKGAWEVDHSRARSRGGSDTLTNLRPAHPWCNRVKKSDPSWETRRAFGLGHAPLSKKQERTKRKEG